MITDGNCISMSNTNIQYYWAVATVYDGVVDMSLCNKVADEIKNNSELLTGVVTNADPKDTKYKFCESNAVDHQDLINHLFSHLIIDDPKSTYAVRYHEMEEGGCMAWHDDSKYKCSFSIYLSDCIGGELQVMSPSGNESIVLAPITGRCVRLERDVTHCVLDVEEGVRRSLQIFEKR